MTAARRWTPEQEAELRRLAIAAHPRLRVVLDGLDAKLSWVRIAAAADATVECVKGWDYEWKLVERGLVPTAQETAWRAAFLAKLVRQQDPTPSLRVGLDAYLLELWEVNRDINLHRPAAPGVLGGHGPLAKLDDADMCTCNLVHAGGCF